MSRSSSIRTAHARAGLTYARHTHEICDIFRMPKRIEVKCACWCGKITYLAAWDVIPSRGWSIRQWRRVRAAMFALMEAL